MLLFFGGRFVFFVVCAYRKIQRYRSFNRIFGILAFGEAASVKVRNMLVTLIFESRHRKNKAISSHNLCMTLS